MTWRRLTTTLWFVAALTAGAALCPEPAPTLQTSFHAGTDSDSFIVSAESDTLPKYTVRRTGAQEITVTFQTAPGEKSPPAPGVGGSKLVSGVRAIPGGFKIQMRSSGFGYVNFPVSGKQQLQIQVFSDPVGARWEADKAKPEAKTEAKAALDKKAEAEKKRQDEARAEEGARKKAEAEGKREKEASARREKEAAARQAKVSEPSKPEPARPAVAPAALPAPAQAVAPAPQPQQPAQLSPAKPNPAQPAPAKTDPATGQPYYSVPYSMRMPVNKTVLGLPAAGATTLPQVSGQLSPGSPAPTDKAPEKSVGGKLPAGVVEKPILQDHQTAPPPRPAEILPVADKPAVPISAQAAAVDVQPQKGKADVRFRADRRSPEDARLAEIISGTPPAPKAPAAAPAQIAPAQGQGTRPWEMRQQVQKGVAPTGEAPSATQPPVAQAPAPDHSSPSAPPPPEAHAPPAQVPLAANASDHGPAKDAHAAPAKEGAKEGAKEPGKDAHGKENGKEPPGPPSEQQLKDKVLSAQTLMSGGQWKQAATAFEEVLREPGLKGDLREEALYALADTYMQLFKDAQVGNYDKIAGAQLTAMNANQKSRRVPRALLNLGLLNLKVGNLAEAKAYFNIIRNKYKLDQNAAMVPFALGEHYRSKGDLQKAAEQYQQLIQDHPDSKLAKDTAYLLAQTLRRLGNFEKAFQIVDYIDKRWPLFYMDAPDFLRLAAEIEEKVGKLAQAKDHYWTYYNLNPTAEFADVTLVRIGDIYLRQNKRPAAKEVYQKAVRDFPEREGGLVARMRIAEEGVFDDPTMTEMVSVFGRPEALKPNETYELIIAKYPQSPLAPLAQIKLGMWQFYSKAYLDAINTASSFLEKYPKSPLTGKAKELGFQSFLLALPQLVQEGNYQRVLQLFDSASFVKENQDKIGDEALMAIAVSAWKRGSPDRALKLAGKFLSQKQVPKYSEMALDLAMNIFMERKEWSRISSLASKASAAWKLSPRQVIQFEQARAMALENQGEYEKSQPLWTRIASDPSTDLPTRAFATYTLAKAAARKQDMHRLFALSQDALSLLLQSGGDKDKIKDCLLMSITATERSGRYTETLKWAKEFDRIIPDSDPDWAPVRLRLADIYRQGGQFDEWKALLQDIVKKKPGTVYSRMASQSLESSALDQRLQKYMQNKSGR